MSRLQIGAPAFISSAPLAKEPLIFPRRAAGLLISAFLFPSGKFGLDQLRKLFIVVELQQLDQFGV
jgi:hypothetical protein